jgi:hypothetical protein
MFKVIFLTFNLLLPLITLGMEEENALSAIDEIKIVINQNILGRYSFDLPKATITKRECAILLTYIDERVLEKKIEMMKGYSNKAFWLNDLKQDRLYAEQLVKSENTLIRHIEKIKEDLKKMVQN